MSRTGQNDEWLSQRRTTLVSIAAAGLLVAMKLGVGLGTGSLALISAGIESSGDVIAATVTFFAVRLGGRPADIGHPYGHRRAENLGALGESAILLGGGAIVSVEAISHLVSGARAPGIHWYLFAVIALALAVDMLGSLAVLAGLLSVEAGFSQGDSVAALLVAVIIFGAAGRLIAENANVLMDRTPAQARAAAVRAIGEIPGDIELRRLRLRESAGRYFADVIVSVPPGRAVVEGHQAADLVEAAVEQVLPGSDVVVHVEPRRLGLDLRERVLAIALAEPLVKEAHDITIFEQQGSASVSLHLKFPPDLDLRTAHETAERVERAILARPGVADVQTHLEPLERPLGARPSDDAADERVAGEVRRVVCERTGSDPQRMRLLSTDAGRVLFLTLAMDERESLTDAHRLAGELEEELRQRIEGIADVIVHTEP